MVKKSIHPTKVASNSFPGDDVRGARFGRLTAIKYVGHSAAPARKIMWLFECDCGNDLVCVLAAARGGNTTSCGCARLEMLKALGQYVKRSDFSRSRVYKIWSSIKMRCFNSNHPSFYNYGARGITMCDEWKSSAKAFAEWSEKNGYSPLLSIDRINVNGNYEPSNCRWTDGYGQANNMRTNMVITHNGESRTAAQWDRHLGFPRGTISHRITSCGFSPEDALARPVGRKQQHTNRRATP